MKNPPTHSQAPTRRSSEAADVRCWHKADMASQIDGAMSDERIGLIGQVKTGAHSFDLPQ